MSGANERQRETGGRRGWWLVGSLALIGAALGAFAGHRIDPDVSGLVPSLAVAGLGLGGLIGLLLLAPVGLWRAWRRWRIRRRTAASERTDVPEGPGLWHAAEPEREAAATEAVGQATAPDRLEEQVPAPGADLAEQEQLDVDREEAEGQAPEGPEPEEPPPPAGEEPGWYPDPTRDGVRRYWDGQTWTSHVWAGRTPARTRKTRSRGRS